MAKQKQAAHEAKRRAKDFNYTKVGPEDLDISDPEAAEAQAAGVPVDREYPKHLHKAAGQGSAHEWIEVTDATEEAQARAHGWKSAQECDADNHKAAAAAKKAEKPAKRAKSSADAKKAAGKKPAAKKGAKG